MLITIAYIIGGAIVLVQIIKMVDKYYKNKPPKHECDYTEVLHKLPGVSIETMTNGEKHESSAGILFVRKCECGNKIAYIQFMNITKPINVDYALNHVENSKNGSTTE